MEQENKVQPIMIIQLVLLIATLGLSLRILFSGYGGNVLKIVCGIMDIITLLCGLVYFAAGYKKNAAAYYKIFMALLTVENVIKLSSLMASKPEIGFFKALVWVIPIVLVVILATAKDLGKAATSAVAILLVVFRIVILIFEYLAVRELGGSVMLEVISQEIASVMLAGSAGLMVAGKYKDKTQRGAK